MIYTLDSFGLFSLSHPQIPEFFSFVFSRFVRFRVKTFRRTLVTTTIASLSHATEVAMATAKHKQKYQLEQHRNSQRMNSKSVSAEQL